MGLVDRQRTTIRETAKEHLREGEQIQAVFSVQNSLGVIAALRNGYRAVVVTDQRILVCRVGRFRIFRVRGIQTELPRATEIGEPSGVWWHCTTLGPEPLYVGSVHHDDIRDADRARVI